MVQELRVLAVRHTDLIDVPVAILVTIYRHRPLIIINADTSIVTATTDQGLLDLIVRRMVLINVPVATLATTNQIIVVTLSNALAPMDRELLEVIAQQMVMINVFHVIMATIYQTMVVT